MSFLHPALLWLLPLAAIPLVLHLLTLHRLKTVELSTFRFLFDSYVQQRRRMQFLEALLAMLRTLFLLGVVLVICRPMVRHWGSLFQSGAGREVVLLVDCSASMNTPSGGVPALKRAQDAAGTVVERLGADDRLTLVRVAAKPEEVFSRFGSDRDALRKVIEGLKAGPARANFFAALGHVFGPDAPQRNNLLVYLFTDCQASGWREAASQGLERLVPEGTPFIVVNVGSATPVQNLAVTGTAPRRRAVAGLPVYLTPRVVNHTAQPADVSVKVFLDEKEVALARLSLKPGESGTQRVIYYPNEPGVHRGRFELTGAAADGFPDDNHYDFTLTVAARPKVLIVNGNPAPTPLENEAHYLRTALVAGRDEAQDGKPRPAAGSAREFMKALDIGELPEASFQNAQALLDVSVVVLANCAVGPQHQKLLRDFVAAGGGLLIFPGDRSDFNSYNALLGPPSPSEEPLLPVQLAAPEGDPDKADTFERLAVIDFAHPVFTVFDDPRREHFRTVYFYRRFPLKLPPKADRVFVLAEFAAGKPALLESHFGDGKTILAAFPANTKWTNLPVKPDFVALVLRLASYVQHRPEAEGPSVVPADGVAEVSVSGDWKAAGGKVTDAAGKTTPLAFERSGTRLVGAYERTGERGYYTVDVRGGPSDQPKTAHLAFAVNLAPEESDFATVDEKKLRELLPGAKLTFVDATAEALQHHGTIGDEQEVWRPLIWLAFLIIGVEFWLSTLGGSRSEQEENRTVAERIRDISPGTWVGRMTGAGKS